MMATSSAKMAKNMRVRAVNNYRRTMILDEIISALPETKEMTMNQLVQKMRKLKIKDSELNDVVSSNRHMFHIEPTSQKTVWGNAQEHTAPWYIWKKH